MPETIAHDDEAGELRVGTGRIANVTQAMWEYEVSGYKVVRRWFNRRKREPEGRTSSPLDKIVARAWEPQWTTELLEMLNVLVCVLELEGPQREILDRIAAGALLSQADLGDEAGASEKSPVRPERQPRQTEL